MSWRPKEGWDNPYPIPEVYIYNGVLSPLECAEILAKEEPVVRKHEAFEAGANKMHKADVAWLIQRIIHDDRGYVFDMNDKEWQEFIDEP